MKNSKKRWVRPSLQIFGTVQSMTQGVSIPIGSDGSCPPGFENIDGVCFPEQRF